MNGPPLMPVLLAALALDACMFGFPSLAVGLYALSWMNWLASNPHGRRKA